MKIQTTRTKPGYLPETLGVGTYPNITLGAPGSYPNMAPGVPGFQSEYDPYNEILYPDTPEYYSTKRTLANIVSRFRGLLEGLKAASNSLYPTKETTKIKKGRGGQSRARTNHRQQ